MSGESGRESVFVFVSKTEDRSSSFDTWNVGGCRTLRGGKISVAAGVVASLSVGRG